MTNFRAYWPGADPQDVLSADNRHFPLRATAAEAVVDVQDAWHKPSRWDYATRLTVFEIDGETVTEREVKVQRRTVLVEVGA